MAVEVGLGLLWYVVFVVSTVFHEAAHGFAALKLGDTTARDAGLVTLDPVSHIQRSPLGMVIVPILSFAVGGWMIGGASTPYDPYWARRNRRSAALMALAGPAANLVLALVAAVLIRLGMLLGVFMPPEGITFTQTTAAVSPGMVSGVAVVLSVVFSLNLILLVFNLLPLPPLDGSGVVSLFLDDRTAERYHEFIAQPTASLIGFVVAWNLMNVVLGPIHGIALNLLYLGAAHYS
jgi:Zn-dependent protease